MALTTKEVSSEKRLYRGRRPNHRKSVTESSQLIKVKRSYNMESQTPNSSSNEVGVVWPLAPVQRTDFEIVPRPDDLNGKTVAFVWDYVFRGDEMFPIIESALRAYYPDVNFVSFEAFGNIHGHDEPAVFEALPDRMREYRVDAALVGVGA